MVACDRCLVCLVNVKLNFIYKMYYVQGYCKHLRKNYHLKPNFKISKIRLFYSIFVKLLELLAVFSVVEASIKSCSNYGFLCLMFTSDVIFFIGGFVLSSLYLFHANIIEKELNLWLFIYENYKIFGIFEILADKEFKTAFNTATITHYLTSILGLIFAALVFLFSYDIYYFNIFRKLFMVHYYFAYLFGTFDIVQKIQIIGFILKALCKTLKRGNFENSSKLISLVTITGLNFEIFLKYTKYVILVFIIISQCFLICTVFIIIKFFDLSVITLTIIGLRTFFTILALVLLCYYADDYLTKKVSLFVRLQLHVYEI